MRTPVAYADRASLTVAEARRFTGLGYEAAMQRIASNRWRWFWEGKRRRIITASIIEDQERQAERAS